VGKVLSHKSLFRLRQRSLARGTVLAMVAFVISLRLGGFPDLNALHSSHWQIVAALLAFWGMVETARCLGHRWSLFHAGVLLLLCTDLMILAMAVLLFLYP
jgi:hypothetical protein